MNLAPGYVVTSIAHQDCEECYRLVAEAASTARCIGSIGSHCTLYGTDHGATVRRID